MTTAAIGRRQAALVHLDDWLPVGLTAGAGLIRSLVFRRWSNVVALGLSCGILAALTRPPLLGDQPLGRIRAQSGSRPMSSRTKTARSSLALLLPALALALLLPSCRTGGATGSDPAPEPARPTLRTAICQILAIDSDRSGNLRRIEYALEDASRQGARLACFPETAVLGWINPASHRLAAPIPGADTEHLAGLARKYGMMICVGICEKEGDRLYDAVVLIGADGTILGRHRKINTLVKLLDPPYAQGRDQDVKAVETPVGRVVMLICADTFRKSLVARAAALKPDLLLVPYGWAATMDRWPGHGESLSRLVSNTARRVGCAMVGTDLVGMISDGPWRGRTYGGHSVVADGSGRVLARLRDRDVEVRVLDIPLGAGVTDIIPPRQASHRPARP